MEMESFEPCVASHHNEFIDVVIFMSIVCVVGFLAYMGVLNRKRNVMSLYDSRIIGQRSRI